MAPTVDTADACRIGHWKGPFAGQDGTTKDPCLFSAWNVVPDVVSAILSYEAERRMVAGPASTPTKIRPSSKGRCFTSRSRRAKNRSRHRLLLLLLPCLPLADQAHPLDAPGGLRSSRVGPVSASQCSCPTLPGSPEWRDRRPAGNGRHYSFWIPTLRPFLRAWRDGALQGISEGKEFPKPNPELFDLYINDLLTLTPDELGRRPPGLVDLLTEVALGSPCDPGAALPTSTGWRPQTTPRRPARGADLRRVLESVQPTGRDCADSSTRRQDWSFARTRESTGVGCSTIASRETCKQCLMNNGTCYGNSIHGLGTWEPDEIAAECTQLLVQIVHPARSRVPRPFF